MNILGLSCFYHDAAAALLKDGEIIAAAQEERFTRVKHDPDFPKKAINFCLKFGKLTSQDLDAVAFYDKPFLKFERILMTSIEHFPKGIFSFVPAMRTWLGQKLWIKQLIYEALPDYQGPIYFPEHHTSHAASAFLVSPFKKAAILTTDGVGEWATATRGLGQDLDINLTHEIRFPDSLGLLYSAFTYYLGFKVNSAEYKVMGLAPYGKPIYKDRILNNLIKVKNDGSFKLNLKYFAYPYALSMTSPAFHQLFDSDPRPLGSKPRQREMDLASSLQKVTEEIMLHLANDLYQTYKTKNLCMAGGVALNCVANGEILRKTPFENIFIQPAAGDAGGAIGAAAYVYHTLLRNPRNRKWEHAYLGPEYSDQQIEKLLKQKKINYRRLKRKDLTDVITKLIVSQKIIGLFQGRMEFGPRALGNRSILADARNPENQDRVNLKIKFRESFRPFAPTALEEDAPDWFDLDVPSPYMLLVAQTKSRKIPSVTHVDNSARIQTINKNTNPFYWEIINKFKNHTGVPVIINTSFNQRGEPIVCSPQDALNCFLRTDMDYLAIGSFLVNKKDMPKSIIQKARQKTFALD
jgi:carbamoyltransferase